jgi:FtsP/CotA-like multicopper oxidase with cupredoxin domain
MKRRNFLLLSSVAASYLLTGNFAMLSSLHASTTNNDDNEDYFTAPLSIPPLLEGKSIDGVEHYDLNIQKSKHSFFKNILTNTYGINGSYLAPTLKLVNGKKVSINYTNKLDESTTMHGHGMHLPAQMDGGPHQTIQPNKTWSAKYTVNQKACTNWYHSHAEGKTAQQVYKGLAGFIIIEDEESKKLDLPKRYGKDDIPLVFQDRFFHKSGDFYYQPSMMQTMMGYNGNVFMTNGVVNPYIDVEAKELRLRLLNGSNSTMYNLKFNDNRAFKQIVTDNSFLEKPVSMNSIILSPGERAEIIVDLTNSYGNSFYLGDAIQNKIFVKLNVSKKAMTETKLPSILTKLEKYDESEAIRTRSFTLSAMRGRVFINNKIMDMHRIDEVVPLNQVEIWEVSNKRMMSMDHNFHIHGTHFMILERNGESMYVDENEAGYKDTVYIPAGESVKLILKMTDYKDEKLPYMYHCHFLEHEDRGMMGQFIVS